MDPRITHTVCSPRPMPARSFGSWLCVALLAATVSSVGCGSGLPSLSGTVLLDGEPVLGTDDRRCTLVFIPEGGAGARASAVVDDEGRYTAVTGSTFGLPAGRYAVGVSVTEVTGDGEYRSIKPVSPARYSDPKSSGIVVEVKSGSNTQDIELTAEAPDS